MNLQTEKDNIIDDMDEVYSLDLSDEEYKSLRCLTRAQLLLVTLLLARSHKTREEA